MSVNPYAATDKLEAENAAELRAAINDARSRIQAVIEGPASEAKAKPYSIKAALSAMHMLDNIEMTVLNTLDHDLAGGAPSPMAPMVRPLVQED